MADPKTQDSKTTNELDELEVAQVVKKPTQTKADPVKTEPVKADPVKADPVKVETSKPQTPKPVNDEKKNVSKPKTKAPEVAQKPSETVEKPTAKNDDTNELLQRHTQMVHFTQNLLSEMEVNIKRCKIVLKQLSKFDPKDPNSLNVSDASIQESVSVKKVALEEDDEGEVVEGKFDGYFMLGNDQKKYPVPLNYSSKTKMVPGDKLKLKIMNDGKFIYKLIQPAERKHIRAILSKTDDNKYIAMTDEGKMFFLNQAAVTFHKGRPGDELYIVTNKDESGGFAAIEAVIKK